jgi:hypothetical protein
MSDHLVRISPVPIETIDHVGRFAEAARNLVACNCVYKIPYAVATYEGDYIIESEHKLKLLLAELDEVKPWWSTIEHASRAITADYDIDMHGNPYHPSMLTPDYLHYHRTIRGTVTATFARAFPGYLEDETAKDQLTTALRGGMTDTRYADPSTFQQAYVAPGEVLVFRLCEYPGLPFLHDFQTTSQERVAEITAMMRTD